MSSSRGANPSGPFGRGPSIAATALWGSSGAGREQLLTDEERTQLAVISSVVRFKRGARIYREGDRADAVFNIISGVVKSHIILPNETKHIVAFLFADDLIGLTEEGRYVNSAEAVTAVTGYRIPVPALENRLRKDAILEFRVICKLCHELREAQRHAFLLSRHHALAKTALFIQMLETHQASRGESTEEVYLPMRRTDIGDYVGLSPEAVSRSFRALASRGVITFRDRRHLKIVSEAQLESVASEDKGPPGRASRG